MESVVSVWGKLDARRRLVVVGATLAMFAAVLFLARGPGPGTMALLYAGLDPAAAGEVVAALEARGTPYEVRGDAIWVPESARDQERMTLASEGLPATSGQGYELLDSLSGFGTTSQMFDAAYWRAKEGELARTILAVPSIRGARVHISAGASRPFRREDAPTAAVTVTTRSGALGPDQADALRHLVAAAVPGLDPADVAVIDAERGLVAGRTDAQAPDTRAEELAQRAQRLLEARVGAGNAVVEVSIDAVTESERITERSLDPEGRVVISTDAQEGKSSGEGGGSVTVASNLPDGEAQGGGPTSSEESSHTVTNYDVSETSREVVRAPGAVRRLTVAVLVNDVPATDAEGVVTFSPRPAEELAALGELVSSAVGVDAERGDVLTVKSMPFEPLATEGSEAAPAEGRPFDLMSLLRPVLLALVAIVLGLFVVRPLLRSGAQANMVPLPPALPPFEGIGLPMTAPMLAGDFGGFGGGPGEVADAEIVDPAARLRRLIEERQDETAQILQSWIDEVPGAGRAQETA
ncbi:flagellar basal-body MS-ring/collar protein FliF [Rubellimicrobium aerolatum]|uniref:Flagellar M-ring protein n=1 Tax=Rubellimicrobium aerolatum TaxID=490979 RepID=A0ABW0SA03_9RHOB|nr:flagellar basal-body MS-ring/collar protein FliF [Rubellimicrobium aerolatum]MBP1805084.1 flagellar M-ring protein FliF [Rubellimicrobium aerolatum]